LQVDEQQIATHGVATGQDADAEGRRRLMLNAGMTLHITGRHAFSLSIPTATMRAGCPRMGTEHR